MKIISKLPHQKHYTSLGRKGDWYIYQDNDCPKVKIYSSIPSPFNQSVCILFSVQNKKSDEAKFAYSLILKVFPISQENQAELQATLVRDHYKSEFSYFLGKVTIRKWFSFFHNGFVTDYYYF